MKSKVPSPARFLRALSAIALLSSCAAFVPGCDGDDEERKDDPNLTGEDLARGMLGVERDQKGAEADAANGVVRAINERYPGRLEDIRRGMYSGDAESVLRAKRLLDEALEATAGSETYPAEDEATFDAEQNEPEAERPRGGDVVPLGNGGSLVEAQASLTCQPLRAPDGRLIRVGMRNGRFGDGSSGLTGAGADVFSLGGGVPALARLLAVERGEYRPDWESRLGAFAATRGYEPGTVGRAVHAAIGHIYLTVGTYGEEKIGRVFNSSYARPLFSQPVASCASFQIAALEFLYWRAVRDEDPLSAGGQLGSFFTPRTRDLLQRRLYGD